MYNYYMVYICGCVCGYVGVRCYVCIYYHIFMYAVRAGENVRQEQSTIAWPLLKYAKLMLAIRLCFVFHTSPPLKKYEESRFASKHLTNLTMEICFGLVPSLSPGGSQGASPCCVSQRPTVPSPTLVPSSASLARRCTDCWT